MCTELSNAHTIKLYSDKKVYKLIK